jgi:hypothetical protein
VQQAAPTTPPRPAGKPARTKAPAAQAAKPKASRPVAAELQVLASLRDQGILTEEEYQTASKRLTAAM